MTAWTIEPIPLYRFVSPGPEVFFQRGFGELIEMVIYAYILTNGSQRVLVDTGLPEDFSVLNAGMQARKGPKAGFKPVSPPLETVLQDEPDLILVTSFGPYAVGGLDRIAGPVVCSERGLRDLNTPEEAALVHPVPTAHRERLSAARTVAGSAEIAPGLHFMEIGIHHPASAAICIRTEEGVVGIADPVFTKRNLQEGLALGAAENAAGWFDMVRSLGSVCDALIPIHDLDPTPLPRAEWSAQFDQARP